MFRAPTLVALALCLSACSSLLGLEGNGEPESEDRDSRGDDDAVDDAPGPGPADVDSGTTPPRDRDSGLDGAADAGEPPTVMLPAPACGDMSAYADSTWPMAAGCPTFPVAAAVPALRAPRVAWHRDYAADAVFMSGASLGADGSIYTAIRLKVDGASRFYVIGISAGGEREILRVELPGTGNGWYASPTIAADGTLYVRTDSSLVAIGGTPAVVRWSVPLAGGRQTVPLLLPNGTLIVAADHELVAVDRTTGAKTPWISLGTLSSSPTVESVVLSPAGVIYALVRDQAQSRGLIYARTASGEPFFEEKSFEDRPWTQPSFDADGRLFFVGRSGAFLSSAVGAPLWHTAAGDISTEWFSTPRGGNVYFATCSYDCFALYDTGARTKTLVQRRGEHRAMVATGDGSFLVTRTNIELGQGGVFEALERDGSVRWSIPGPAYSQTPHAAALGAAGQYYVPAGNSLYAVTD